MAPHIILECAILAVSSFTLGLLPLHLTFARAHLAALSVIGTGLLLGAALGIIIPEGFEALSNAYDGKVPEGRVAASLLAGFAGMVVVEHFVGGHSHSHDRERQHGAGGDEEEEIALAPRKSNEPTPEELERGRVEFDADAEVFDADHAYNTPSRPTHHRRSSSSTSLATLSPVQLAEARARAVPLTLGLCFHGITDGLALGASALAASSETTVGKRAEGAADLSFVVFLALFIHKAPTALALSTSLLGTSLPRSACKKHIAAFALATPFGALLAYGVAAFVGMRGEWTGVGMLVSGGSFLYVATVLQPKASSGDHERHAQPDGLLRPGLLLAGMVTPFLIASVVGHGH